MTDTQWLSLILVGAISTVGIYLVFVLVPGFFWTLFTVRLRDVHRQMAKLIADDPRFEQLEELREVDGFLHDAIGNKTHFGLAGALTTMLGARYMRSHQDDYGDPFEAMTYTERVAVISVLSDAMRLTFIRAFMGSSLWFLTWPLAFWAGWRFSRVEVTDEDWNTTARIVPLESYRDRDFGAWPLAGSHGRHQTVG